VYNEKFVPIGELSGKSYVRWVTDPGEHTIRVFSRNKPEITDIFEAGEIYYFLLEVPVISNSLVLRSISADVASKYIVGCADKTLISAFLGRLQEQ
jgi:hypothetical protein